MEGIGYQMNFGVRLLVYYKRGTVCECNMKVDFQSGFLASVSESVNSIVIFLPLTDCDSIAEIKVVCAIYAYSRIYSFFFCPQYIKKSFAETCMRNK